MPITSAGLLGGQAEVVVQRDGLALVTGKARSAETRIPVQVSDGACQAPSASLPRSLTDRPCGTAVGPDSFTSRGRGFGVHQGGDRWNAARLL